MKRAKYISNGTITYKIIGDQGPQGPKGDDGKSAYQIAVDNGYNGTESEWLETLKVDLVDVEDKLSDTQNILKKDNILKQFEWEIGSYSDVGNLKDANAIRTKNTIDGGRIALDKWASITLKNNNYKLKVIKYNNDSIVGVVNNSNTSYTIRETAKYKIAVESLYGTPVSVDDIYTIISIEKVVENNYEEDIEQLSSNISIIKDSIQYKNILWELGYISTKGELDARDTSILSKYINVKRGDYIKCAKGFEFVVATFNDSLGFVSRNEWCSSYKITYEKHIRVCVRASGGHIKTNDTSWRDNIIFISNDDTFDDNVYGEPICNDIVESFVNGLKFGKELENHITDFKKEGDKMVHVSTFCIVNSKYYVTYYANTITEEEDPTKHTARFVYCPTNNVDNKTYIDLCNIGDLIGGKVVSEIYDIVLLKKDNDTLYLEWTAKLDGTYYRVYRTFDIATEQLSTTKINTFTVENTTVEFSTSGMKNAFSENNIAHKPIELDIGIMQKLTKVNEEGTVYYYTGCYANEFNCIIKSADLVNWTYVSQPTFNNNSQYENAVYAIGNKIYYFCRQYSSEKYGFLSVYDISSKDWEEPLYIYDCQSRSDFFEFNGKLYLIHAPKDRYHLSIVEINQDNIRQSKTIQTAWVSDGFYPFVNVYDNELYISYTQWRKHIWLSKFSIKSISMRTINGVFEKLFNI